MSGDASMTIFGKHESFQALMECLVLGITEAVSDAELGRPIRVPMPDVFEALMLAQKFNRAMIAGSSDE